MASNSNDDESAVILEQLLDCALPISETEGWTDTTFESATVVAGVDMDKALEVCPKRGLDLALAFDRRADEAMVDKIRSEDMLEIRYRDRVARSIQWRFIAVSENRESVRKSAALFALPVNTYHGVLSVWKTVDTIWNSLGDSSEDINWYTKRMLLSGVYSSTLLYWLGDKSPNSEATWEFIDRRIDNVMQIEECKSWARSNPAGALFLRGLEQMGKTVRKPQNQKNSNS